MNIEKEMFLPTDIQVKKETDLFNKYKISSDNKKSCIDIQDIKKRPISLFQESYHNFPQNIFEFTYNGTTFIGRKFISREKLENRLLEMNCSRITADMILGVSSVIETSEEGILLFFHELDDSEKLCIFHDLKDSLDTDIHFPFVYVDKGSYEERRSPEKGWALNPKRANNLGAGEKHIRKYTIELLKKHGALDGKKMYDPACSTGQFLSTIKQEYPSVITIGQDLSQDMVDYAKDYLDEAICADASENKIESESCDYIFVRFLNSEVVTRMQAYFIFPKLVERLRINGYIIIFGHTPVLLNHTFFTSHKLKTEQCIGYDSESNSLFQYYVLKRFK